jgi:aldose 1-epimerase
MQTPTPSGRQVVLVHGDQQAVVVEVGGGLRTYDIDGRQVLDGYRQIEMCAGGRGQPLLPWPNRLADGRYEWEGRTHQVALSEPATATAIHGLTRWSRWEPAAAGTDWVTMTHRLAAHPGYPWTLDAAITYTLDDDGLSVATTVVNRSAGPAPFGLGFHPYLSAGGGPVDDCTLALPAATAYDIDERGLPVGRHPVEGTEDDYRPGRRIGERRLDLALTDLTRDADGRARVVLSPPGAAPATTLWLDGSFTHLQVFSGDTLGDEVRRRKGLAVEPMTGPADSLVTGDGRRTLVPGEPFEAVWGIHHW